MSTGIFALSLSLNSKREKDVLHGEREGFDFAVPPVIGPDLSLHSRLCYVCLFVGFHDWNKGGHIRKIKLWKIRRNAKVSPA